MQREPVDNVTASVTRYAEAWSSSTTRGSSGGLLGVVAESNEGSSGGRPYPLVHPSDEPLVEPASSTLVEVMSSHEGSRAIWVERPEDGGSAVWGCTLCDYGGWCPEQNTAMNEAVSHAASHGGLKIQMLNRRRGPKRDAKRDAWIQELRNARLSIRAIATTVGLSTAGVIKSLKRPET